MVYSCFRAMDIPEIGRFLKTIQLSVFTVFIVQLPVIVIKKQPWESQR